MPYPQKRPEGDLEPVFNMGQLDFFRYDDILTFIDRISIVVLGRGPMMSSQSDIMDVSTLYNALSTFYRNIMPFIGKKAKGNEAEMQKVKEKLDMAGRILNSIQMGFLQMGRIPPENAARLCRLLAEIHEGILILKQDLNLGAPLKPTSGGVRSEISAALGEEY